jgi:MFS family permease
MDENEDKNSSPSPKKESPLSFPRVKVETPEHREKRHLREQKELVFREKQLAKPPRPLYLFYLFFVLCLAYIVDEAASQIGSQFQSNIIESFFEIDGRDYTSGLALMSQIGLSLTALDLLILVYKPLSDRFGRKPFLVLNTAFMALGLLIISLAHNLAVYMVGSIIVGFFIGEDVQVVYILESAPRNRRGIAFSLAKGIAILGTMIIPLLRQTLMMNQGEKWQDVYLGVALFGFVVSAIALFSSRESTAFLESRIAYLKMTDEKREALKMSKEEEKASQGGLFDGLRFAFSHKQLRNLLCASFFMLFSSAGTGTYESIMSKTAGMSDADITFALWFFILGNAIFVIIPGFVSDRFGRKKSALVFALIAIASYSAFFTGSWLKNYPAWLMGLLAGVFSGSFWGSNDNFSSIMVGESTPTNLRASVITVQSLISVSMLFGSLIASGIAAQFSVDYLGLVYFCYSIPGMVIALLFLTFGVGETKGIDLETVTGSEWDMPKRAR